MMGSQNDGCGGDVRRGHVCIILQVTSTGPADGWDGRDVGGIVAPSAEEVQDQGGNRWRGDIGEFNFGNVKLVMTNWRC